MQLECLPAVVAEDVLSNDPNVQLEAATQFRKLLSSEIRILSAFRISSYVRFRGSQIDLGDLSSSIRPYVRVVVMYGVTSIK